MPIVSHASASNPQHVRRRLKSSSSSSSSSGSSSETGGKGQVHVFFPDPNAMAFDDSDHGGKGKGKGGSKSTKSASSASSHDVVSPAHSPSAGKGGKGKGGSVHKSSKSFGKGDGKGQQSADENASHHPTMVTSFPTCTPTQVPSRNIVSGDDEHLPPSHSESGGKGKGGKGSKSSKSSYGKGGKGKGGSSGSSSDDSSKSSKSSIGKGKGSGGYGGARGTKASKGGGSSTSIDDECIEPPDVPPSAAPTSFPTSTPTIAPTILPTIAPSAGPTIAPSGAPTTNQDSAAPTTATPEPSTPTVAPSNAPSTAATEGPSQSPSALSDSAAPTSETMAPTVADSQAPSMSISEAPTVGETEAPSSAPTPMCMGSELGIMEFFLVDADNNVRLRPMTNGETFSLEEARAEFNTESFAIEVATIPDRVGSVRFDTSVDGGDPNVTVSNAFPYAVAGVDAVGSGLFRIDSEAAQYRNGADLQNAFRNLGCQDGDPSSEMCLENSPPFNVALVVDLSLSTLGPLPQNLVGDLNNDGVSNSILDAQIAALVAFLDEIAATPGLDNSNVNVGLIPFDTEAIYVGNFNPLDDNNLMPNPDLVSQITNFQTARDTAELNRLTIGYTNFDDGLDKALDYFEQDAPPNRQNVMVFMSDGVPNVRGDGDEETFCAEMTNQGLDCADTPDNICFRGDTACNESPYATCLRGSNLCAGTDSAVTNFDSEILRLDRERVRRIAIGVGRGGDVSGGIGDIAGDFETLEFLSGQWTVTATPFCEVELVGESGPSASITFTVLE